MLYSNKSREDSENLNELVSLNNQVDELGLQDKLDKQNFHENLKKLFEPLADTTKDTSREKTKTITETYIENIKTLSNSDDKLLEIMNDRGIIERYLLSLFSIITNPENTSQFKLLEDPSPNRVNDLIIHTTIPVSLYNNLLTFRDTDKRFEIQGELLKMITKKTVT